MLLDQQIEVTWIGDNIQHFKSKGYKYTKNRDKFLVSVFDLPKNSHKKIEFICDYCNNKFRTSYQSYNTKKDKSTIKKDSCKNCISNKNREVSILKYGVEHPNQLEKNKSKIAKSHRKYSMDYLSKYFMERNLIIIDKSYKDIDTPIKCLCRHHLEKGFVYVRFSDLKYKELYGCKFCSNERKSKSKLRENNPSWKGGITPLHLLLRGELYDWKVRSILNCDRKCVITGKIENLDVHHLYSFNKILSETLDELNIDFNVDTTIISEEELTLIKKKLVETNEKYGLGVCLTKEVHKQFHNIYGNRNNTPEQFEEFKQNYFKMLS